MKRIFIEDKVHLYPKVQRELLNLFENLFKKPLAKKYAILVITNSIIFSLNKENSKMFLITKNIGCISIDYLTYMV